jgi:thiol-disulfide isomerase/thioredoxin
MRRAPTVTLCAVALLVALAACGGGKGSASDRFQPLQTGDAAPRYAARTLAGDSARVGGAGEPLTLLNVWATWCAPCRAEFPELEQLHQDYAARGLRVLAVSIDDGGDAAVERFAREQGIHFTIARDPQGRVQRAFQTIGVPESFLIASDGTLLWRHFGAIPPGGTGVRKAIEARLAPLTPPSASP